jgi:hypothetical protein
MVNRFGADSLLGSAQVSGMTHLATVLILSLASAHGAADEHLWLEGIWRSDADSTIEANPVVETFSTDVRRRFRSLFGKTAWNISGGILSASHDGVPAYSAPYFIRPANDEGFELVLDGKEHSDIFSIRRTEAGFCATLSPSWVNESATWTKPAFVECYVRTD